MSEKSFKIYVLNSHQAEIFSLCHNSTFKFLALMEAKSSVMFSKLLLCIYLSSRRECHIWQIMTQYYLKLPISTYKFLFLLMSVNQGSSIKHSFFYVVSFSLESFINFFQMSSHMDKLFKELQLKCFWFHQNVCSVDTNCEIGS